MLSIAPSPLANNQIDNGFSNKLTLDDKQFQIGRVRATTKLKNLMLSASDIKMKFDRKGG